jgi:hypothetical protein
MWFSKRGGTVACLTIVAAGPAIARRSLFVWRCWPWPAAELDVRRLVRHGKLFCRRGNGMRMRASVLKVPVICFGACSVASACLVFLNLDDGLSRTQAFQIWLVSHLGSFVMLHGSYWSRGWVWLLVSLALILPSIWRRNEWTTVCCTFGFIIWFGQAWAAVIESV